MAVIDVQKCYVENPIVNDHLVIIMTHIAILLLSFRVSLVISLCKIQLCLSMSVTIIQSFTSLLKLLCGIPVQSHTPCNGVASLIFGTYCQHYHNNRDQITMHVNAMASSLFAFYCITDKTDDNNFGTYLESFVQGSLSSTSRRPVVSHDVLAMCRGIHTDCIEVD